MEDSLKAYLYNFLGEKRGKELIAAIENGKAVAVGSQVPSPVAPRAGWVRKPYTYEYVPCEESQAEPIFRRFIFQGSAKLQAQLIDLIAEKGLSHEDLILILQTLRLNPELTEDLCR